METGRIKKTMALDTLLYVPGKILEGLVSFLTLSLYSHYFVTSDYGKYNIATVSANVAFLLTLNWISQSVFRYINKYRGKKRLTLMYSTVFRAWAVISGAMLLVSAVAIAVYGAASRPGTELILFLAAAALASVTYGTTQILFSLLSAIRSLKLFLAMSLFSVTFKLLTTTVLVMKFNLGILSALISIVLIDCIVTAIIVLRLKIYKFIIPGRYSRVVLLKFRSYGIPLIANGISMSLLNVSDRYALGLLKGTSQVGIYSANYGIASAVFSMLNFALMRASYPSIIRAWRQDERKEASELLSHAVRNYLLLALPAAAGLSMLSGQIARLFLEEKYHAGSFVIIWVSVGMVLLGLTEYSNKAWELTSRTAMISKNSVVCGVYNIVSNLVFIPFYGYTAAAVNTTLSYLVYFCLSFFKGKKILSWRLGAKTVLRLLAANGAMALLIAAVLVFSNPGKLELVALVLAGAVVYSVALYITGEIRPEVRMLAAAAKGFLSGTRGRFSGTRGRFSCPIFKKKR